MVVSAGEYLTPLAGWDGESCFITALGHLDCLTVNKRGKLEHSSRTLSDLSLVSLQPLHMLF